MRKTIFNVLCFLITFSSVAQVFNDGRKCNFVNATNTNKKVCVREAPVGKGNSANIKRVLRNAGIPQLVLNSRLVNGVYANNIADLPAVKETAALLNNRRATYTGGGVVVTQNNLEAQRGAIARNGGTFIFRGNITVNAISKFIQVGSNTTIWIDGKVTYTGPQPAGTVPDEFSVSDVINGIFEVRGVNHGNRKNNVKFFGTKRGKIVTNGRCAGIFTHFVRNLKVSGINFERCRNVLFINATVDSELSGNFIYKSERRAIHLKGTNKVRVTKNLIFEDKVDGIDVDAFAKNSTVDKNVICHTGDRFMIWTEIAVENTLVDQNVAMFLPNADQRTLGFQENGSETTQPPTKNNTYSNNHVFYADINKGNRGFVLNPTRRILRGTITFKNNYVWQSVKQKLPYEDPKPNVRNDVYYYLPRTGTPPPPPPPPPTGIVTMRKGTTNFGIDGGNGGANGQNAYLWSYNASNFNQQWVEINRGGGFYSYQKRNTNFCLDGGNGGANGQNVYLWTRNDSNQNQHWRKVAVAGGRFRLEKRNAPGFSIDGGNGGANSQNLYLWASNNNNVNQQWTFANVGSSARASSVDLSGSKQNKLIDIEVHPNPVGRSETLYVDTEAKEIDLSLLDFAGRLIHKTNQKSIDFGAMNMVKGIYLLQINTSDGKKKVKKIIIE